MLTPVSRQCLKSRTFSLCLSLVSSPPNPKCLGSSHVPIPQSWPMSRLRKKCLDSITKFKLQKSPTHDFFILFTFSNLLNEDNNYNHDFHKRLFCIYLCFISLAIYLATLVVHLIRNVMVIFTPANSFQWKKRSERRKAELSPCRRPLPGDAGRPKFNQLEMVTTFTYKPIFWSGSIHAISSYRGNKPTHKHRRSAHLSASSLQTDRTDHNTLRRS